jgi:hypothetical protein
MPIVRMPHRLRLVFHAEAPATPGRSESAPEAPRLVELTAYAGDCRLSGYVALEAERLSDLLNDHDEYELIDVLLESLEDGHAVEVSRVLVGRAELYAVQAGGPRGDPRRRTRARLHPVALQAGPYALRGYLHALPGVDPMASFHHRRRMVPLTEARIEYSAGDIWQRQRASTLVVNRLLVDWVQAVEDEAITLPGILAPLGAGPLLKDFTGRIGSAGP